MKKYKIIFLIISISLFLGILNTFSYAHSLSSTIVMGDGNGNFVTDVDDARSALRTAVKLDSQYGRKAIVYDTDGDGTISVDDARMLLRIAVRLEEKTVYTPVFSENNIFSADDVPDYTDEPYVVLNSNVPYFYCNELVDSPYLFISETDDYGRCQTATACVCKETFPTEERKSISDIYPTGWLNEKYFFIEGEYLFNRCHLIGYQLAGNSDSRQIITGTRYMNINGMLPFENQIKKFVSETEKHVIYRVTPVYDGDNLVADGVLLEACSAEDLGEGLMFCVYCFNVQPDITINYKTGESHITEFWELKEYPSF